ncbi:MAG: hypothetical protein EZS28_000474, partial [Streblomastix strix]
MLGQYRTQIQRAVDPLTRRTVHDDETGEDIVLTNEEIELLMRISNGAFATEQSDREFYPIFDYDSIHPVSNRPTPKSSFLPSKLDSRIIVRLVRRLNKGTIGQPIKKKEENL